MTRMLPQSVWRLTLALLTAASITTQAADRPKDFPLQIPLTITGEGPWYRLQLPMSVQLASHHADLRDLRVFNAAGDALAYSLVAGQARQDRTLTTHKVRGFPLYAKDEHGIPNVDVRVQRNANGTLVEVTTNGPDNTQSTDAVRRGWLLDGSTISRPLERLVLDWADLDGFQRFSIEASDDLLHWRSWGEGRLTRLRFDSEQIEQREIRLRGQKARYLRLLWQSPVQAPDLRSAQLLSSTTTHRPASLIWGEAMPARKTGEHEYVWELPLPLPVERLRFPLDQSNLLLPVNLQTRRNSTHKWRYLTQGLLYRVTRENQELLQEELDLPDWAQIKELKLQIDPRGGGLSGQTPKLLFGIHSTELVFLARGDQPYLLAIGKLGARSAELPLSTLMPGTQDKDLDKLPQAVLAETFVETTPVAPVTLGGEGTDWKRLGLWAVLLGGVLVLILMAWSLLRSHIKVDDARK